MTGGFGGGRGGRLAASALLAVALLCSAAAVAAPAGAATAPKTAHARVVEKPCLELQSFMTVSATTLACVPYGTTIAIPCTDAGDKVHGGPYGSSLIWDQTTYGGKTGYVSDAWVYTGTNNPIAPPCFGTGKGRIMQSPCLFLRTATSQNAPSGPCVPEWNIVTIACTKRGDPVSGPWATSKVWDRTTYSGFTGYLPDARIYTGTAKPVAHGC